MIAERRAHLIAVDVGSFHGLLHRHAELDDVEKELQQILILRIASLHREREIGLAVLECHRGGQSDARTLARLDDVERSVAGVGDEALAALTQADPGMAGYHRRHPATTGRDTHYPALLV